MRSHFILSIALIVLAACGGKAGDPADPLSGHWTGRSTVTMVSGEPVPSWLDNSVLAFPTALVSISAGDAPGIGFLCGGGHGTRATITGSSSLTLFRVDCPPGGVNRDFLTVAIEGGSGMVSDGVLTLTVEYVVTHYGQAHRVSFVLVATRTCSGSCPPLVG